MLTNEANEERRHYKREWARKNRDKVRAQQERYWQKRAAQKAQAAQEAAQTQEEGQAQEAQAVEVAPDDL